LNLKEKDRDHIGKQLELSQQGFLELRSKVDRVSQRYPSSSESSIAYSNRQDLHDLQSLLDDAYEEIKRLKEDKELLVQRLSDFEGRERNHIDEIRDLEARIHRKGIDFEIFLRDMLRVCF
jgi:chromosome segregation ATPase